MFNRLRMMYERYQARRELRRKGIINPHRIVDWDSFANTIDRSPAPAIFILVMVWVVSSVLMTLSALQQNIDPGWVIGQEATRTIHASCEFNYIDKEELNRARQAAMERQPEFFRVNTLRSEQILRNFNAFFKAVEQRIRQERDKKKYTPDPDSLPSRLAAAVQPPLLEELGKFCQLQEGFGNFENRLRMIVRQGIIGAEDKAARNVGQRIRVITVGDRRLQERAVTDLWDNASAAAELAKNVFPPEQGAVPETMRSEFIRIAAELIGRGGDLDFDDAVTRTVREEAAAAVPAVPHKIAKGELLVSKGDIVTPSLKDKLQVHREEEKKSVTIDIGIALLSHNMIWSLVLIIFAAFYLYNLHPDVVRANKRISLIGLVVIISMLVNFGAILSYNMGVSASRDLSSALVVNAIPIALGSVLLAVIFGYRVALCVGFFISSMTAMMVVPERAFDLALKGMVISSLAGLAVRSATDYRSYFLRIVATVFPLTFVLNFNLLLGENTDFLHQLSGAASLAIGNAFLTAILALVLTFLFEIVFNVSTNMALMVLCDYNHPLLERLKREAPGTFFHSLMVATLVEDAARAIGANPLKAKAGALFHDIGKLAMPQYFTENNLDNANQHLNLNPQMSSIIIRDHVKEGLALARQYRMCRTVRDAIEQHHGNDLVHYFYAKALADKRREGGNAPVLESQFRYSGRPPQDREMAIISLADACEAASRSLDKPSAAKIEAVVNGIFQKRFEDGQLNQANITLAELEKVRQSFINTLISMKHGRIAYQREQREEDEEPAVLVGDQAVPPAESK